MKILLVEDEAGIANFLIRGLKYEGYAVDHVVDGEEALDKILNGQYGAVVLDLLLPSMDGEKIVAEVRREKNTTPIIVLTAISDTESKIRILNLGADDFLTKPFSFMELAARIKSMARRSQSKISEPDRLVVKDLVLVPREHLVMRDGKIIKLRLKEFELLQYLMSHINEVISRSSLTEKVWDYNAQIFSNSIDSHISLLRKKINKGYTEKLIETIHGIGYVLRGE